MLATQICKLVCIPQNKKLTGKVQAWLQTARLFQLPQHVFNVLGPQPAVWNFDPLSPSPRQRAQLSSTKWPPQTLPASASVILPVGRGKAAAWKPTPGLRGSQLLPTYSGNSEKIEQKAIQPTHPALEKPKHCSFQGNILKAPNCHRFYHTCLWRQEFLINTQ